MNNTNITKTTTEAEERFNDIINDLKNAGLRALKDIPVELLTIDSSYQTDERIKTNARRNAIMKLAAQWNENKLESITVVPHPEEHKFYVVNGYGRWQASQLQNPAYKYLSAMVLLGAPKNPVERRKFESDLFAYQDREKAQLKPIEKHGALRNLETPEIMLLEKMQRKYGFSYVADKGQRANNVLGSYSETLSIAKTKGEDCLDFIFEICKRSAFDRKVNGYASHIMRTLRDMWVLFPDNKNEIKDFISTYFRSLDPITFKAKAITKYPFLDSRFACSLYLEDITTECLNLHKVRTFENNKVVKIAS